MEKPLVSVIIPTYSRPSNLCRAINSVLAQTYNPIEVIVVDDNGEGTPFQVETEKLLKDYITNENITYIKHSVNKNGSAARNTGVRVSHGYLISLMDDDDYFMPNKIEEQVKRLGVVNKLDDCYKAVYCNTIWRLPKKDKFLMNNKEGFLSEEIMTEDVNFNSSTILIYKSVYEELGGFDERFYRHQDWEFLVRYFRKYKIGITCPDTQLLIKYMVPNALSKNPSKAIEYCEFYLSTFQEDIKKMSDPSKVYHIRYNTLGKYLLRTGLIKDALYYFRKASKCKHNTMKERFLIVRCALGCFLRVFK